jgi:hypothetical protein
MPLPLCYQDWDALDGGSLDLYNADKEGRPGVVTTRIVPRWNSFCMFAVSSVSHHQVRASHHLVFPPGCATPVSTCSRTRGCRSRTSCDQTCASSRIGHPCSSQLAAWPHLHLPAHPVSRETHTINAPLRARALAGCRGADGVQGSPDEHLWLVPRRPTGAAPLPLGARTRAGAPHVRVAALGAPSLPPPRLPLHPGGGGGPWEEGRPGVFTTTFLRTT